MTRSLWFLAALGLTGCGTDPVEACLDLTTTFTDKAVECGLDEADAEADALYLFTNGGCESVQELRKGRELTKTCLPWIEDLSCDQFLDTELIIDPSCEGQLLY
ncbi:MAG: hypothetical protein JXX28_17290 [Deltaproteobacteria bacterium]|nr:hypothetical protein [Deltaproteobacteria bacterium]